MSTKKEVPGGKREVVSRAGAFARFMAAEIPELAVRPLWPPDSIHRCKLGLVFPPKP